MDGTLPTLDADSPNIKALKRCNNMVIGWLIASMELGFVRTGRNTGRDIERGLEERFGQTSSSQ